MDDSTIMCDQIMCDQLWSKIRDFIRSITKNSDDYDKKICENKI